MILVHFPIASSSSPAYMVNGKRTPAKLHSPPAGICDLLFKFLINTLAGKRIKHLTLGGGASESVPIHDGGEILIQFRHKEAKNKKKDGKIVAGKAEHPQPEAAWMNSHPKKPDSRFRGNPVQEIAVWSRGKEADDTDKYLAVIHHHRRRSARSDVNEIAEDFIKSRMDAIRKRALNIGPDHSK